MATLYDYYNTDDDSYSSVGDLGWWAQTFTTTAAYRISSVKLRVFRSGSPGILVVGIRATDGSGHPTGLDLCSGSTDSDTLTTDDAGEWREITLSGLDLATGTKYAIVVRAPDGFSPGNTLRWRCNDGGTYAGGQMEYSDDSGVIWAGNATFDFMFETWGGAVGAGAQGLTYTIEVRDSSGDLLAILENAFGIGLTEQLNRPPMLDFRLPADDSKIAYIDPDNEIWLRDYEQGTLKDKFLIARRRDVRS